MNNEYFKKIELLLKDVFETNGINSLVEFMENAKFSFTKKRKAICDLLIVVEPKTFIKNNKELSLVAKEIINNIKLLSKIQIREITIEPDFDRVRIVQSKFEIVKTKWHDINEYQKRLIENLTLSKDKIDYKNIGNTSRELMKTLSNIVFVEEKHKHESIVIRNYKDKLRSYVLTVLSGKRNKELRSFSEKSIEYIEKSIDLMNATTHKDNTAREWAEISVHSALSGVNIIKMLNQIEERSND